VMVTPISSSKSQRLICSPGRKICDQWARGKGVDMLCVTPDPADNCRYFCVMMLALLWYVESGWRANWFLYGSVWHDL
jgi:hypothetical protein